MWETIVVGAVVLLVLIFTVRHIWRIVTGKASAGCGQGCSCALHPSGCGQMRKPRDNLSAGKPSEE